MAKRTVIYPLIAAGDMSGDITSAPFNIQYLDNIGLQLSFTGTPEGTFAVEVSNDYNPHLDTGTWGPLTLSTVPTAAGADDSIPVALTQLPFIWLRVNYTQSASDGVLNVTVSGKELS